MSARRLRLSLILLVLAPLLLGVGMAYGFHAIPMGPFTRQSAQALAPYRAAWLTAWVMISAAFVTTTVGLVLLAEILRRQGALVLFTLVVSSACGALVLQALVSYLRFKQLTFAPENLEHLDAFGRASVALYLLAVCAAGWAAARKHVLEHAGATIAMISGLLFCVAGLAGLPPFVPMILAVVLNLALLGEAHRVRRRG